jgi:dTDP-4-amino-4,6-dideoxygalactose transaminase
MQKIPFYQPSIGPEEIEEVMVTLQSGWLTTGPKTKQFEADFAGYVKQKHAVAVNSCTAALHLALEAIGLKPGDGVIVPTMTFAATAEVVRYLGGRPILADCRIEDSNLDISDAERKIQAALSSGQPVAAIIPVHYGGQIGDLTGVRTLAERHNLKIIEDAAHCCPALFREKESELWQSVGFGADISCYSFYANKTITTGEGGMACTQNDEYADRMRIMSLHGISRDAWKRYTAEGSWYYEIIAPGYKYNLTDIASAIGIHQLRKADLFHKLRNEIVAQYRESLKDIEEVILPVVQPNRIHSWHLFVIRLKLERLTIDRARFIAELQQRGVATSVHWMPLHMHPYYRQTYGYAPSDFPVAASLYPEIVTLPLYPGMRGADVDYVCGAIREVVSSHLRLPAPTPKESTNRLEASASASK